MTTDDQIKNLMNSIGALAEIAKITYDSMKKQGFGDQQALELTKSVIATMITGTAK